MFLRLYTIHVSVVRRVITKIIMQPSVVILVSSSHIFIAVNRHVLELTWHQAMVSVKVRYLKLSWNKESPTLIPALFVNSWIAYLPYNFYDYFVAVSLMTHKMYLVVSPCSFDTLSLCKKYVNCLLYFFRVHNIIAWFLSPNAVDYWL